jgi:anti-sigma B factor antagonist
MHLDIERLDDTCTAVLHEERLDALSAAAFRLRLMEAVQGGCRRLVLDLSRTALVDSSGLGVLVSVLRRLPGPGSLVLRGVTPGVDRTLRLARLDRLLVIEPAPAPEGAPRAG